MSTDTGKPDGAIMRVCGWCEDVHPENLSISWFPSRLYFCTPGCHQEWAESAG